jgi:hypothetical protein
LAQQSAWATCGDYVMLGGSNAESEGHHPSAPADHSPSNKSKSGLPGCHGPNCHRQAPVPLGPKPQTLTSGPQQWAVWIATRQSEAPAIVASLGETRISLGEGHFDLPERPPRCDS